MAAGGGSVLLSTVAMLSLAGFAPRGPVAVAPGDPVASVWYRGVPAGVPRLDDLAEIKALGFSGVTWPLMSPDGGPELRRMADIVGLTVVIRDTPAAQPASQTPAKVSDYLDVQTKRIAPSEIGATVWRAIARGVRVISFDAGADEGAGISDGSGRVPEWIGPAAAIARQLEFNGQLIATLQPGPGVTIESGNAGSPGSLDVACLDADRSWVLVATNLSASPVHAVARLLPGVPYALWLNLLDAHTMSMLNERSGPRWTFDLEAWGVRVYVIDKVLRTTSGVVLRIS